MSPLRVIADAAGRTGMDTRWLDYRRAGSLRYLHKLTACHR
jgi:hypothetical protein